MSRRALRVGAFVACALYILIAALPVTAQSPSSLTREQLQIFQSLSPEQQQAVLSAVSQSSSGGNTMGQTGAELPQPGGTSEQPGQPRRGIGMSIGREGGSTLPYGQTGQGGEQGALVMGPPRIEPHSTLLISVTIAATDLAVPNAPAANAT